MILTFSEVSFSDIVGWNSKNFYTLWITIHIFWKKKKFPIFITLYHMIDLKLSKLFLLQIDKHLIKHLWMHRWGGLFCKGCLNFSDFWSPGLKGPFTLVFKKILFNRTLIFKYFLFSLSCSKSENQGKEKFHVSTLWINWRLPFFASLYRLAHAAAFSPKTRDKISSEKIQIKINPTRPSRFLHSITLSFRWFS